MRSGKFDIIITENMESEEGKIISTVGLRYFEPMMGCIIGDYEKFDGSELTDEQIIEAVQRLMPKFLPMVPKEERQPFSTPKAKGSVFKRTPDGEFIPQT